jgi:polysaccharide export outer membrane protein
MEMGIGDRMNSRRGIGGVNNILARMLCIGLLGVCGGCSFLATDGPSSIDIRAAHSDRPSLPYALIPLTPPVVDILASTAPKIGNAFVNWRPPSQIVFGIGDVVSVTVFEAAAGGLFIPAEASVRPGNFITLPNQPVDSQGNISVPYAGLIHAQGHTPAEVQQAIVNALKNRAIEPQAVVALIDQKTSLISVLGEVNNPVRYPASAEGERVLDAITRAGGPKGQGFDTWVMLERGGRRATVPFGALVYDSSDNIYVHPYDTIYVYREPQTFVAFGATGSSASVGAPTSLPAQYNFDAWRLSLAEAVAKAGGLNDNRADSASVFLYRGETREVAEKLGVDVSTFQGPIIPIIYDIDLHDPAGYFLATKFEMRNKDVIYVSNSGSVETTKAMDYFREIVGTVNDPIVAASDAFVLKSLATGSSVGITNVVQ